MKQTKRQQAFEIYKESGGKATNAEISEELDVPLKSVSGWKSRHKWDVVLGLKKCSSDETTKKTTGKTTVPKFGTNNKDGKNKEQKKRSGNPNPQNQFTHRNNPSTKHGLLSKYIPPETLELMGMLDSQSPADILWTQIQIQYSAILRSQEIMFVTSKEEMVKELKKKKESEFGDEVEYDFQFAWDRQATFMNALSRAQSELRAVIKQFNMIADEDDERRLKLDAMQVGIVKSELDIEIKEIELQKLQDGENDDKTININFVRK